MHARLDDLERRNQAVESLVRYSSELKLAVDNTRFLSEKCFARVENLAKSILSQVGELKEKATRDGNLNGVLRLAESKIHQNIGAVELRLKFLNPKRMAKTKREFQKKKRKYEANGKGLKKGFSKIKRLFSAKTPSFFRNVKQLLIDEAHRSTY